ncbi:MAG: glycosyltransferase, partial [Gemmatimonadota bacterium]
DTGFSRLLPSGEGVVGFRTFDEAVAGARSIDSDYERHSRAARLIAEECFDSDKVLGRFLEAVDVAP